jgi:lysophospholipase L1-like esterase
LACKQVGNQMRFFAALASLAIATALSPAGSAAPDSFSKFQPEIEAFSHRVAAPPSTARSTLFLGSSSIRLWDVTQGFPALSVVNRGFGGATTPDVLHYYPQVIGGSAPASVVVYVGENDIAAGATPAVVATDILTLLDRIRTDFPRARIAYLSIKPSPARWDLWPQMRAVNAAIEAKAGTSFSYLDVGTALLAANGAPDPHFFSLDGLHMNALGYARWNRIVDAYLEPREVDAAAASS